MDRETHIQFLLGELPEDEQTRLEELFMNDEELHELLLDQEEELFFDYEDGQLSSKRQIRFRERFLQNEAGVERLAFTRSLAELATSNQAAGSPSKTWRSTIRQWLATRPFQISIGVVALAACVLLLLMRQPAPQNEVIARMDVDLYEVASRSQASNTTVPTHGNAFLRLHKSDAFLGYTDFEATLLGKEEDTPLKISPFSNWLRVSLKLNQLDPGLYEIEIRGKTVGGKIEVIAYFQFEKPVQ